MTIDIPAIVQETVNTMSDSGKIEELVRTNVRETVSKAIVQACSSYEVQRAVSKRLGETISKAVEDVGLSAYNTAAARIIHDIVDNEARADFEEKLRDAMRDVYLGKRTSCALSEIVEAYRKENLDDDEDDCYDGEDGGNVRIFVEEHAVVQDWLKICKIRCGTDEDLREYSLPCDFDMVIEIWIDHENARIQCVTIQGKTVLDVMHARRLSKCEALAANLLLNATPIELDYDRVEDFATSFEIR